MHSDFYLSLREATSFENLCDPQWLFRRRFPDFDPEKLNTAVRTALQRICDQPERKSSLEDQVRPDGAEAIQSLHSILEKLDQSGLLIRSVQFNNQTLVSLIPQSQYFSFEERHISLSQKYCLSRFAYLHAEQNELILESPLSLARVVLAQSITAAILQRLTHPATLQELCSENSTLPESILSDFVSLLFSCKMVCEVNSDGISAEEESVNLRSWEFHDFLYHTKSRAGRHDRPAGGTFRFAGIIETPPVLKPAMTGERIELFRPDLNKLKQDDPPFAHVQEERCSIREYSEEPITDQQLGEFLYRVIRVSDFQKVTFPTRAGFLQIDSALRPYPSGGALYELELYVTIQRCNNLPSGFYHYDPDQHALSRISPMTAETRELLNQAAYSMGISADQLQTLITISARFQRVAWKYATIAYSIILKNTGVLYQTMYLAATAMGLAPCGIGYGDSELFSRVAGTEYIAETSVGEFALGSRSKIY
jgi:oxazoline/thiazoline dehydrogenase